MNESLLFLKKTLAEFYRDNTPPLPERFGSREFGFIGWPKNGPPPFVRHVGFRTRGDYQSFLRRQAPWHFYYSTALYQRPSERRMVDKGWLGAELIFDLDADHLPGAEEMDYPEQLEAVKKEFRKLLDEFIFGDFGFDEKDVRINFSGGRGYHCHVLAKDIMRLEARHRRQIADYVTGKGVEDRALVRVSTWTDTRGFQTKHLTIPDSKSPGWEGRVGRGVVAFLEELMDSPRQDAEALLLSYPGIGPRTAERFLEKVRSGVKDDSGKTILDRVQSGVGDQGPIFAQVLGKESIRRGVVRLVEGETDEPVTADAKRLIRVVGSVHGKTGLGVVPVDMEGLQSFTPLRDAVVLPREETQTVISREGTKFSLMDQHFTIPENDPVPLPIPAAFFAVARRLANIA